MKHVISGPATREAIGIVTPFDMELDYEMWRFAPDNLDLLFARTPFIDEEVSVSFTEQITEGDQIYDAARSVLAGRASTVTYACTSGSFAAGKSGEERIRELIKRAGATNALTTSGSVIAALKALNVSQVSIATPYTEELSGRFDGFLEEFGITANANAYLGLGQKIWEVPYEVTAELVRSADRPQSEAVIVSCTNLPTYDLIAPLEEELGKPIVSANQATVWAAAITLGLKYEGPGQLARL